MNRVLYKNNLFRNGKYKPDHSVAMVKQKAKNIYPSLKQVEYMDDLYKFCIQKGVIRAGFPLGRTRQAISSNIRAFIGVLERNGLADEFFGKKVEQPVEVDNKHKHFPNGDCK